MKSLFLRENSEKYLQLNIISLDVVQSPAYVHPERVLRRGVLLPRLEAVGTQFLLPRVLHEAVALCGHRCLTAAATAKVPLHHHPERKTGEIVVTFSNSLITSRRSFRVFLRCVRETRTMEC